MGKLLHSFLTATKWPDLPAPVRQMAMRCLLDLAGTGAAGAQTDLARIAVGHAVRFFAAGAGEPSVRILFDGRSASSVGAALAGGMVIDSYDAHDGHVLTKGHAGCALLPALLALCAHLPKPPTGAEFLTTLVVGYEIALRSGIAQHRIALDYHTSGAWNALGVVAMGSMMFKMTEGHLREALGIAEYHGPRSQMMRCIDFPTMVKDGSGWGAMTGLSAVHLAREGFTGAPALVVEDARVADLWDDLGDRWRILELYFKPHPVCRWAQPAIEAVLSLTGGSPIHAAEIASVEIETFHNAVRLDQRRPATTEEAQYSLPFPVAAALAHGRLPQNAIMGAELLNPDVLAIGAKIRLIERPDIEARFPAERLALARITLTDGRVLESDTVPARGDAERPLDDDELITKYNGLAEPTLGPARAVALRRAIEDLPAAGSVAELIDLLSAPLLKDAA